MHRIRKKNNVVFDPNLTILSKLITTFYLNLTTLQLAYMCKLQFFQRKIKTFITWLLCSECKTKYWRNHLHELQLNLD